MRKCPLCFKVKELKYYHPELIKFVCADCNEEYEEEYKELESCGNNG